MATTTYRQISRKLRIQRGPGRPDKVSERPSRENKAGVRVYLDSDEAPTLIEFDEFDIVDIDQMLRIGAIAAWSPPATGPMSTAPPAKGV